MDNFSDAKRKILISMIEDLHRVIKRRQKFEPERRFLMLTDNLVLLVTGLRTGMMGISCDDIRLIEKNENLTPEQKKKEIENINDAIEKTSEVVDTFRNELYALEDYIQSDSKSILKNMENKLDEVLLGPYYKAGQEMMKNAKDEFHNFVNQ